MMNEYECIRCKYRTIKKSSMINHLRKVKKCDKSIESMEYNDTEIFNISITKIKDRVQSYICCDYCKKNYCNIYVLERHKINCKKKNDYVNIIDNNNIIIDNDCINNNIIDNIINDIINDINSITNDNLINNNIIDIINNINNSNNNNNIYILNIFNNIYEKPIIKYYYSKVDT